MMEETRPVIKDGRRCFGRRPDTIVILGQLSEATFRLRVENRMR